MKRAQRAIVFAYTAGFRVTDQGIVLKPNGEIQKLRLNNRGYLVFTIKLDVGRDGGHPVPVHRLAAFQKYGCAIFEENVVVRHKNGMPDDSRLENILIGTPSDNSLDVPAEKRMQISLHAAQSLRKLSDEVAKNLLADRKSGMTYKELSAKYGVTKSSISYLVHGRYYKSAHTK